MGDREWEAVASLPISPRIALEASIDLFSRYAARASRWSGDAIVLRDTQKVMQVRRQSGGESRQESPEDVVSFVAVPSESM
jgi:hypothetical protein